MFSIFKSDPTKKLQKTYEKMLKEAMLAQRSGDIKTYSLITAEAQKVWDEIQSLKDA